MVGIYRWQKAADMCRCSPQWFRTSLMLVKGIMARAFDNGGTRHRIPLFPEH